MTEAQVRRLERAVDSWRQMTGREPDVYWWVEYGINVLKMNAAELTDAAEYGEESVEREVRWYAEHGRSR